MSLLVIWKDDSTWDLQFKEDDEQNKQSLLIIPSAS